MWCSAVPTVPPLLGGLRIREVNFYFGVMLCREAGGPGFHMQTLYASALTEHSSHVICIPVFVSRSRRHIFLAFASGSVLWGKDCGVEDWLPLLVLSRMVWFESGGWLQSVDMNNLAKNLGGCRSRWDYKSVRLRPWLPLFRAVGVKYTNVLWTGLRTLLCQDTMIQYCPAALTPQILHQPGCLFAWYWCSNTGTVICAKINLVNPLLMSAEASNCALAQ